MTCEIKLRLVRVPQAVAQKTMVGWGTGTLKWRQELRPSLSALERVSVLTT